jgi:hypothetical protein
LSSYSIVACLLDYRYSSQSVTKSVVVKQTKFINSFGIARKV